MSTNASLVRAVACAGVLAAAAACGGTGAAPAATKSGKAASSSAGTTAGPCVDLVQMVQRCIDTRMPEDERAEARSDLSQYQGKWAAFLTDSRCQERIVSKVRGDEYECYRDEATKRGIQTPCTLVTRAEVEAAVKTPVGEGVHRGEHCSYEFKEKPFIEPMQITVHWSGAEDEVKAARLAMKMMGQILKSQTGMTGLTHGETLDGLGDEAFFGVAGIHPMLTVRKADASFEVEGAAEEAMIQIARLAVPRLTPDPSHDR
jgi:hypothetical protein